MKKLMTLALILSTALLGVPATGFAQTPRTAQLGTISGEAVDAGGRALVNQRVELLRYTDVLDSTTSGSRGEWSFANVAPGDYVVRTVINGKVSGIRVSVVAGQATARALIVAPSAAAPSAMLATLPLVLIIGGISAAVITTVVVVSGS